MTMPPAATNHNTCVVAASPMPASATPVINKANLINESGGLMVRAVRESESGQSRESIYWIFGRSGTNGPKDIGFISMGEASMCSIWTQQNSPSVVTISSSSSKPSPS